MPETRFTTVVAVDAKTLPQLQLTYRTWRKHKPEVTDAPLLVIYDRGAFSEQDITTAITALRGSTAGARLDPWPATGEHYDSQREKMLTAFVCRPPRLVETQYWLKLDTDAVALDGTAWITDDWFHKGGGPEPRYHAWIASPWGYTKPADQMSKLDAWGNAHPTLSAYPPLNLPWQQGARRCGHARMCSWISFYNTAWSREAADAAEATCGPNRIPVPSQDGYHWYFAERRKDRAHKIRFNRRGWTNIPRYARLRDLTEAVMRDEPIAKHEDRP